MHNIDRNINEDSLFLEKVASELIVEALNKKEYINISMGGTSMLPTIDESDELAIERYRCKPKIGDIIAYKSDNGITAHRLIKIDSRGRLYTKGDNRLKIEGPIELKSVIGKITKIDKIDNNKKKRKMINRYIAQISFISGLIYCIIAENKIFGFKGRFTDALRLILNSPMRFLEYGGRYV